jgi:ATP-dependent Clp protease adaptor protein ClpS
MSEKLPTIRGNSDQDDGGGRSGTSVVTERKVQARLPALYRVLLHNDDYTPMDFVVMVLETFFSKDRGAATEIMLSVHTKGVGVCGVFPFEIAETKVALVMECARENEHPLQCTMEKV